MGKCSWFHRGIDLTVAECHMWSMGKNRSKALAVCSLNDAFKIYHQRTQVSASLKNSVPCFGCIVY